MSIFNKNSKSKNKTSIWGSKKVAHKEETSDKVEKEPETDKSKTVKKQETKKYPEVKTSDKKISATAGRALDPDIEFQLMYGILNPDRSIPSTSHEKVSEGTPIGTQQALPPVGSQQTIAPIGGSPVIIQRPFIPRTVYKRLVNKKLTVILVENTATVAKQKDKVLQIVENFVRSDLLCIINYGSTVNTSDIIGVANIKDITIMYEESAGEDTCLFDALAELEKLVSAKHMVTEEKETERVCIDSIDVIGIGTCTDNCSSTSKEDAINKFYLMSLKPKVVTKYYCLTDEYFIGAAEIGFHSIGAISKAYQ